MWKTRFGAAMDTACRSSRSVSFVSHVSDKYTGLAMQRQKRESDVPVSELTTSSAKLARLETSISMECGSSPECSSISTGPDDRLNASPPEVLQSALQEAKKAHLEVIRTYIDPKVNYKDEIKKTMHSIAAEMKNSGFDMGDWEAEMTSAQSAQTCPVRAKSCTHHCFVCEVCINGIQPKTAHDVGKKHAKKLRQRESGV